MAERKRKVKRKFSKRMQIKLMAIFAFVLCALVGLNIRIAYIAAKSGEQYTRKVLSQKQYDSRTIPFRRGEIQDRNGNILAKSEKVYNVVLDCYAINSEEDYLEPTIQAVVSALGLEESKIRAILSAEDTKESQYQVVAREVSMETKQKFDDYTDTSEEKKLSKEKVEELGNVQGVWFEEDFIRRYPLSTVASTVVGFSNDSNVGSAGLESYYNNVLNGVDGREYGYLNEDSELQRTTIEPTNGNSIISTIDANVQQVVEKYVNQFDEQYKDGPNEDAKGHGSLNTGVIVGNPNTGEILGMATNRGYDLNNPQDLTGWYTDKEVDAFTEEELVEKLNERWSNFCISSDFELGSTYKPVVVASALEAGATADGDPFTCNGYLQVADRKINCDNVNGHGPETLSDVVKNSCNVGMMTIAANMGVDVFSKYQSLFNFGMRTGIDLPNEGSGLLYDNTTMHEVELATNSFGQTFTSTMLQEYAAFSAVVNGGYYYRPHMVRQVLDPKGGVAKNIDPLLLKEPISSKNSGLLKEYLEEVVESGTGTGTKAQIPGYRIGGKTGTAEKLPRDKGKYVVSFIGAVPIDNPQIVIYVVIDEPNVEDQEIGGYTMQIAKGILSEILPYLGVYPTEEITDQERDSLGMQTGEEGQNGTAGSYDENGNYVEGTDGYYDENGNYIEGAGQDAANDWMNDGVPDGANYNPPPEDTGQDDAQVYEDGITNEDLDIGQY